MQLRTLPVYSKLTDSANLPQVIAARLPPDWQLSQHQLETYQDLANDEYDVLFNTGMTGDGKSMAGQLRPLIHDDDVLAMYPTNELILDQDSKLPEYQDAWKSSLRWDTMFGARITELMTHPTTDRMELMRRLLDKNRLLLTNPDLFQMLMSLGHSPHFDARLVNPQWLARERDCRPVHFQRRGRLAANSPAV